MIAESNRIEFKLELTNDLEKEAVAFFNNKEGGLVNIGVDKSGCSVGVSNIDSGMLKIIDRLKHNITPSCMGLFD
jgi:predicted HTH transcriptional regulator